jgi:radical SAM superfamily enzyme YgiQ (UPF0313 family)
VRAKFILPAPAETKCSLWKPINTALFPPLGLATLAGHMSPEDEIELVDEHIEEVTVNDTPDLVVIQVYITNAYRAYALADCYRKRGSHVILVGLHVTTMPQEACQHADTIIIGPGDKAFPQFLEDFRRSKPRRLYYTLKHSLKEIPGARRDLIKREHYLAPNALVVSRGCPHHCNFCYKDSFFLGGRSFYTQRVDRALAEIESLPGSHLHFLDDHLLGHRHFAEQLFEGMQGMGRVFHAAATVDSVLQGDLIEKAVEAGLQSLFIGFETLNNTNLEHTNKWQTREKDYRVAIQRLSQLGVTINSSFTFGQDHDDKSVFRRTVDWAIERGLTRATFHILTPYPGTQLYEDMKKARRILDDNWNHYNTREVVFRPRNMSAKELKAGYNKAYQSFYKQSSIPRSCHVHHMNKPQHTFKQFCGNNERKKLNPPWNQQIKQKQPDPVSHAQS